MRKEKYVPIHLILQFKRGTNRATGEEQWQARIAREGISSTYVPSNNNSQEPKDENELWVCCIVGKIFQSEDGQFRIYAVELVQTFCSVGDKITCKFKKEKDRWQQRLEHSGVTTIYVPDRDGPQPENPDVSWRVKVTRPVFVSRDGSFRIIAVELLEECVSARAKRRRARKAKLAAAEQAAA